MDAHVGQGYQAIVPYRRRGRTLELLCIHTRVIALVLVYVCAHVCVQIGVCVCAREHIDTVNESGLTAEGRVAEFVRSSTLHSMSTFHVIPHFYHKKA
jgi:hypothetical protein